MKKLVMKPKTSTMKPTNKKVVMKSKVELTPRKTKGSKYA